MDVVSIFIWFLVLAALICLCILCCKGLALCFEVSLQLGFITLLLAYTGIAGILWAIIGAAYYATGKNLAYELDLDSN